MTEVFVETPGCIKVGVTNVSYYLLSIVLYIIIMDTTMKENCSALFPEDVNQFKTVFRSVVICPFNKNEPITMLPVH